MINYTDGKLNYIQDVSGFLELIKEMMDENVSYVFRGEGQYYEDTSCLPNIYRKIDMDEYPQMERQVLEKVRSEGFDNNSSYLLTAIEAQHGGFPSRLLDISYNCLIALHFAVTPFYNQPEDTYDTINFEKDTREISSIKTPHKNDGTVFMIRVEDMYIPSSELVENYYNKELLNPNSFVNKIPIFSYGFLMLDYFSKNSRIKAQQGGFILFSSKNKKELPEYLIKKIHIRAGDKEKIRNELKTLFNISNAFVYPESNNSVEPFIKSSSKYSQISELDFVALLEQITIKLNKEFDFQNIHIRKLSNNSSNSDALVKKELFKFEGYIKNLFKEIKRSENIIKTDYKSIIAYNSAMEQFAKKMLNKLNGVVNNINLSLSSRTIKMSTVSQLTED